MLCSHRFAKSFLFALVISVWTQIAAAQTGQLRVSTWNMSSYTGQSSRTSNLQNALFGTFQGRSFSPDILFAQEIQSPAAAGSLVNVMNSAAGSGGDWTVAFGSLTGTNSPNSPNDSSDTAMFYRTSKVNSVSTQQVLPAGGTSANPRDVWRFDFSLNNNAATSEVISVYNVHMKAGDNSSDQSRRQVEALAIRNNANGLAANHQIMVLGDFNIQSSAQTAFQTLTNSGSNSRGRFFDPIATSGNWNDNSAFRFVHTQDPKSALDDRLDMILMGGGLGDNTGTEYVGDFGVAYSTSTWNDPNHSYRVWGNDGTSFDSSLTVTNNQMVGASIAQSLIDVSEQFDNHLPVFADLSYTISAIPEPSSISMLCLISMASVNRRRRMPIPV